jgi:serralysin
MLQETAVGSNILVAAPNKILKGTAGNDSLSGGGGHDWLYGGWGNDTLTGWMGRDVLYGGGNDVLSGATGDDTLFGDAGGDKLNGGDGADTLIGGESNDTLTGGAGNDVFRWASQAELGNYYDRITDFAPGADKIDLASVDANTLVAGDQAFNFIGANLFTGVAGQLRYQDDFLVGDVDGDFTEDFGIMLMGSPALSTADFIL